MLLLLFFSQFCFTQCSHTHNTHFCCSDWQQEHLLLRNNIAPGQRGNAALPISPLTKLKLSFIWTNTCSRVTGSTRTSPKDPQGCREGFVLCWQMSQKDNAANMHQAGTAVSFVLFFLYCHHQSPPMSRPCVIFPVWEMKKMCLSVHANKRISAVFFQGLADSYTSISG